jgi:hypothetical protein
MSPLKLRIRGITSEKDDSISFFSNSNKFDTTTIKSKNEEVSGGWVLFVIKDKLNKKSFIPSKYEKS